jgi:hypothetical protein
MQLTQLFYLANAPRGKRMGIGDFRIPFHQRRAGTGSSAGNSDQALGDLPVSTSLRDNAAAISRSRWLGMMTMPVQHRTVQQ